MNSFFWIEKTGSRKLFTTHVCKKKAYFKRITCSWIYIFWKNIQYFSTYLGLQILCAVRDLHKCFQSLALYKGREMMKCKGKDLQQIHKIQNKKILGSLFQALLIQYLSERVSVKRYVKRALEKFWLSVALTVSWTGLDWVSKVTTRNSTEKDTEQKRITESSRLEEASITV